MNVRLSLFFLIFMSLAHATDIKKLSMPLIPDLQRADIYVLRLVDRPTGILVLCPGCNGNGRDWIENPVWQNFAKAHNLNLAAISFASDTALLENGRGYYYARQGSGQLLLDGLKEVFDQDLPLIIYGFSGGAHFTSGFVEWKPNRVMAWCAYSAEWWDKPTVGEGAPPGLVACGEDDDRLGASLVYFKQGRALEKRWLWLCVPKTGHSIYGPAETFVRDYFSAIIKKSALSASGTWVDIDRKAVADRDTILNEPSIVGWLPDSELLSEWQSIHSP